MKSDINIKLNQMSAIELKEIIDNSFLYDTEIVEKAKELLATKDIQAAPVAENIQEIAPAPSRKKGIIITGISAIVIVIALFAVVFGIRVNNANKYILVEEYTEDYCDSYEYEFDFLNRVTKRYTYTDGEPFGTAYYNKNGMYKEVIGFEDSDCTTYTLKSETENTKEWIMDDGSNSCIVTQICNSHGDVIEENYGEIKWNCEYEYDDNGNKKKSIFRYEGQEDTERYYKYITIKEYKNRIAEKSTTVKGNIELRDGNGKVWLTKEDIKKAVAVTDNGSSYVELTFTASGKEKFASATEQISAFGYGQNSIQIYLNDELISAPVVTQRVESDTVNIAPLTLEEANRIADCISNGEDSSYTTYKADSNSDDKADKIKQKLVGTWKYQGEDIFAYLIDTLIFNSDGSVKNTSMRSTYIGTYDVIEDNSIKLTFTDNTGYAPATNDWNGEYTIDDFSIELKYDESTHSISVPSDEYEEQGYFKGYTYSVAEHDEPSPGSAVPDNYNPNNYNSNEYKKPEVAYYYTINAKAIPKADGSYTFYHICPYCGEETPALSAAKNRKVKCRFSGCTGRMAGYTYTIEAIYN